MEGRYVLQIYLFAKEAINNAVKYSGASAIEMLIKEADGELVFSVNDNGIGFDPVLARSGNGLANMQKRADEIGALLILRSNESLGTHVSMQCKIT
jgi:two-component system, NarL family, sensor histidine kinase UhpB